MNQNYARSLCSVTLLVLLAACGDSGSGSLLGGIEGSGNRVTSAGVAFTSPGSVFVNGVKYDLAGAAITVDGQLARESDLAVGNIVIVEGTVNADGVTGTATRVTVGTAVAGPIGSLDAEHNRFTVLGQTVEVDVATVIENGIEGQPLSGLAVGSDIEVSGFADSSGTIRARRIAPRPADRPLQVTGVVAELDTTARQFTINGAVVDYSGATFVDFGTRTLDGSLVRVTGTTVAASGAFVAEQIAYRDARLPGTVGDAVAVQGWITRFASVTDFDINGYRVVVTPGVTTVVGDLRLDAFVEVKGVIVADGAVQLSNLVKTGPFRFRVGNVIGGPIESALVTLVAGSLEYQATTDRDGVAVFTHGPRGDVVVSVSAPGYETETFTTALGSGSQGYGSTLRAVDAWAIGRAIVLGTRMIDRASDGSAMTFSVDVAVINRHSESIETLTSADFSILNLDCGWSGPRECASDDAGNLTASWYTPGPVQAFGFQPAKPRLPYRARVLVVRDHDSANKEAYWGTYWDTMVPALKSFFSHVGGTDSISLSSVQLENGVATHTALGPFTSDGSLYFDAIETLAWPAGGDVAILQSLTESIASVAGAGAEPSVVVLGGPWLSAEEVNVATAHARQLGVHISAVDFGSYGVSEMTPRTGGFAAQLSDPRQFSMVLGAADQLLAGTMPSYRMEFRLTSAPGAFVADGNAKVVLKIDVPTALPTTGVYATADIAIE